MLNDVTAKVFYCGFSYLNCDHSLVWQKKQKKNVEDLFSEAQTPTILMQLWKATFYFLCMREKWKKSEREGILSKILFRKLLNKQLNNWLTRYNGCVLSIKIQPRFKLKWTVIVFTIYSKLVTALEILSMCLFFIDFLLVARPCLIVSRNQLWNERQSMHRFTPVLTIFYFHL